MNARIVADDLCVRPFDEQDVAAFADAVRESAATVGAWMPWCHAEYSAADARSWIRRCQDNYCAARAYDLGIFSADDAELLGGVAINQLNVQHNFGNIGYWVRQARQGRGVATRAVRMISAFGFDRLKLTRLEIVAAVDNRASRRVAEKAGAQYECIARNRLVVKGQAIAAAVYSLVPSAQVDRKIAGEGN